jgi:succinoglycan biosynthesis transport protein ExoP
MTDDDRSRSATQITMRDASPAVGLTPADLWAAVRRRRWPALWVFAAVLVLAVMGAVLWPASYRSTGTILIEQQELPTDLVQSTITSFADQRIQIISQRVMTTDNLLRVIQRYNLYPELRRNQPREVLLAQMRKDIHLQMISADVVDPRQGHAIKANIAFAVSFESRSPEMAARVANEIISLYLEENVKTRRQLAADAESFLDDEANKLDKNIAKLEAAVAAFKNKHINTLPDQLFLNRDTLIRSQDEIRAIDMEQRSLEEQATYLDAQLAQLAPNSQIFTSTGERVMSPADRMKYLRSEYARLSSIYAPDHPDVLRAQREMAGLEHEAGTVDSRNDLQRQLDDARTQLAQLRERYAADHPDVVRLQKQIDTLIQGIKNAPAGVASAIPDHPDNPAYIQLKTQREVNTAQRSALQDKRADLERKVTDLEDRVASAPGVEHEFADLVRNLNNEQIKYSEVRQKQMSAKLSENLEDEQKGERFTLIDPPLAPEEPTSPNRPLLLLGGLVLALATGLGTIVLLESSDGSVRNRRELELLLEVPPLAILPLVETLADRARQRRRRRFAFAGAIGAFALALILTHLFFRPLDLLWDAALRKLSG